MSEDYNDKKYGWFTQLDLEIQFKAHKLAAGKARVAMLMKTSRKKKHPDYPKVKKMLMYRVLKSVVEGHRESANSGTEVKTKGEVEDGNVAEALIEQTRCDHLQASSAWASHEPTEELSDFEEEGKGKQGRQKKELTVEQQAEKDRLQAIKAKKALYEKEHKEVKDMVAKTHNLMLEIENHPKACNIDLRTKDALKTYEEPLVNLSTEFDNALAKGAFETLESIKEKKKTALATGSLAQWGAEMKFAKSRLAGLKKQAEKDTDGSSKATAG